MNNYISFVTSSIKYEHIDPSTVVSTDRLQELLGQTGYFIDRAETIINAIKPIINAMNDQLPQIQNGPILSLSTDYTKISGLTEVITAAVGEIDKTAPSELQGSELLIEAFNHLGQFYQYIPHLISPTAPSMASYVPSLQQSLSLVIETLDKVSELLPKIKQSALETQEEIKVDDIEFAHWRIACNHMIEVLIVHLYFLLAYETVAAEHTTNIQNTVQSLLDLSTAIFGAQKLDDIFTILKSITTQVPSLISIYAFAQSSIKDDKFMDSITSHLINFLSLIFEKIGVPIATQIVQLVQEIPSLLSEDSAENSEVLIKNAKTLLEIFNDFASTDYIIHSKEALTTVASIKKLLDDPNTEKSEIANAAITSARFIGMSLLSCDSSKTILDAVNSTIILILNVYLADLKIQSESIVNTFAAKLEIFNENSLGHVNYHTTTIANTNPFDIDDEYCLKNATSVFTSSVCLPFATNNLSTVCDEEMKNQFDILSENIKEDSKKFSKWYDQLVASLCMNIQANSDLIVSTLTHLYSTLGLTAAEDSQITIDEIKQLVEKLEDEPLYYAYNVENASNMLSLIPKFKSIIKADDESENVKLCNTIFKGIEEKSPKVINQISQAFIPKDSSQFIAYATAIATKALPIAKAAQECKDDNISLLFSELYNSTAELCALLNNTPSEYEDLKQFPSSIKTSISMILPLISNYQSSSLQNITNYLMPVLQLITEFESAVSSLPQPFIEVDIPIELRTFRALEASRSSLDSVSLRTNATNILETFNDMKVPETIAYLSKWFELANCPVEDLITVSNELVSTEYTGNNDDEITNILARASMASTRTLEKLAGTEAQYLEMKNAELLNLKKIYYRDHNIQDLEIIKAMYPLMATFQKYTNLPTEAKKKGSLQVALSDAERKLDLARKGKGNLGECLLALNQLDAYYYFNGPEQYEEFRSLVESLSKEIAYGKMDNINSTILKLSDILRPLLPDNYNELRSLIDSNIVCDNAYDRSETFREYSNIMLKASKQLDIGEEIINNVVSQMSSLAYEAATITLQSLINEGLSDTSAIKVYAEKSNEIFCALGKFEKLAHDLPSLHKEGKDVSQELRRLTRSMAKRIDGFINYIETPPTIEKPTGFDEKKIKFYYALSEVSLQCERVIARVDAAPVREVIDPERDSLKAALEEKAQLLQQEYNNIMSVAVGPEVSEFTKLFQEFNDKLKKAGDLLIFDENNKELYIESRIASLEACEKVPQLLAAVVSLNDHIIIYPDPKSADKIPDDFNVPPMPAEAPQPAEAFSTLQKSAEKFQEEFNKFKTSIADMKNESIVDKTLMLHKIALEFTETCLSMAVSTVDPRMQVEEQTAIHEFANAFIQFQNGVRSHLMVNPQAQTELAEGFAAVLSNTAKLVELGEAASKILPSQEEEPEANDEVTLELKATAAAIEEMSAKLAEFGSQFGDLAKEATIDDNEDDDDDDDNDNNTTSTVDIGTVDPSNFPSYVISQAQPILRAAGLMLKRAQEITRDLVAQFGHLQNERMLISLAQELSEDAGLILICAEMLIKGDAGEDPEFKVIAAAKIVKATVSQLVAQVLVQGGDPEGIMSKHVRTVRICSNHIVRTAEAIVRERVTKEEAKKPKRPGNKMVQKLNAQTVVNEKRKELQDNEQILYKFRKQNAPKK